MKAILILYSFFYSISVCCTGAGTYFTCWAHWYHYQHTNHPDKKFIITVSEDGTAKLEQRNNKPASILVHTGSVTDTGMSSDGSFCGFRIFRWNPFQNGKWHPKTLCSCAQTHRWSGFYLLNDEILVLQKELTMVTKPDGMMWTMNCLLTTTHNSSNCLMLSPDPKTGILPWMDGFCFGRCCHLWAHQYIREQIQAKTGYYEMNWLKPKRTFYFQWIHSCFATDYGDCFFYVQTGMQTFLNERWLADVGC